MDEINIEDFVKVDLRIAKVKQALEVPEADKLVQLILDVGELGEKKVFLGITLICIIVGLTVIISHNSLKKLAHGRLN